MILGITKNSNKNGNFNNERNLKLYDYSIDQSVNTEYQGDSNINLHFNAQTNLVKHKVEDYNVAKSKVLGHLKPTESKNELQFPIYSLFKNK